MTTILLIGKQGQLGWELHRTLSPLGNVIAVGYPEIDLADEGSLHSWVRRQEPDAVINAAAYTDVDRAEQEEDQAVLINGKAPGILAEEARRIGAVFVHISTDYVFNGRKGSPYLETDLPDPINAYGKSKLAGEQAAAAAGGEYFIFRTSWLYSLRRPCFVTKVLRWARSQHTLRIVTDQIGSPTWSRQLAEALTLILQRLLAEESSWRKERSGVYHLAGEGSIDRYSWAKEVVALDPHQDEQVVREILPALSDEFANPALRPENSSLDCSLVNEVFDLCLPSWRMGLELALDPTGQGDVSQLPSS